MFIILLWIFGILFSLPVSLSLFVNSRKKLEEISECKSSWNIEYLSNYVKLKFVFAYLFPSIVTFIFSFRLILFVHQWSIKSRHLSTLNTYKRRATRLVLSIIISFIVFWSPLWIFQLYDTFNEHGPTIYIQILNFVTLVFVYTNGLLNPLFYLILTQNFRDYLKTNKYFCWIKSSNNSQTFIYKTKPINHQDQFISFFTDQHTILHDEVTFIN
jgi:hypothetical protein